MNEQVDKLQLVTNNLAEVLGFIRSSMEGKGVSPKDAPIVQSKLLEVEQKLRQIGSNGNNLVPDANLIERIVK